MRPVPTDPRTPQQRTKDQLAATGAKLMGSALSRRERRDLADRIYDLEQQDAHLAKVARLTGVPAAS
ncbi:hypothetical protein [Streptomyces sp. NPDC001750]|uniref:hypothetical protein n=1 Tax=Streptomyces sp. NPDC001750 TaxID=3364607 RepID=UPI0036A4FF44